MKRLLLCVSVVCLSMFVAAGVYAATTTPPDVIIMNNPGFKKHTKPLVKFDHKKHFTDYKISCGQCHHDAHNKPLTNLKPGDPVKTCGECHSDFAIRISPADRSLSKAEKIKKYYREAIHADCIGCHRKLKKGPRRCNECHKK